MTSQGISQKKKKSFKATEQWESKVRREMEEKEKGRKQIYKVCHVDGPVSINSQSHHVTE
jgi:IS5 family transposase